jgi:hypothetical protein
MRLQTVFIQLRDMKSMITIPITLACIIHESRVKNPETTTRYKLQRLDLNNSLFCLSVTGLSGEKIMVKKAEKRGQKTL